MKKILFAILAVLVLTQCKPVDGVEGEGSEFANVTTYGLYNNSTPTYGYDIAKHQFSVAKLPSYRFVMQTDDQTAYLSATVASLPDDLNASVDVDIETNAVTGFKNGVRSMTLVKKDAEKAWLWSAQELIGVVVAVPRY